MDHLDFCRNGRVDRESDERRDENGETRHSQRQHCLPPRERSGLRVLGSSFRFLALGEWSLVDVVLGQRPILKGDVPDDDVSMGNETGDADGGGHDEEYRRTESETVVRIRKGCFGQCTKRDGDQSRKPVSTQIALQDQEMRILLST